VLLSQKMEHVLEWIKNISKLNKLIKIQKGTFPEGFHASPKGLSQLVFVTNPITKDRTKRAFLILEKSDKEKIVARVKNTHIRVVIPKSCTYPSLRTVTGINTIAVTGLDYFVFSKYKNFEQVVSLSKWNKKRPVYWDKIKNEGTKKRAFLIIPERFNPYSKNTHLLAFVSEEKLVCPHTLRIGINLDLEEAKVLGLFMNSIIFLSQIFLNREETTGEYIHIMESDLILMRILNFNKLSKTEKGRLLNLFEKLRNVEFPSILEQLKNRFWARVELDKTILKILGFSEREINEWLPRIYDALVEELEAMKSLR